MPEPEEMDSEKSPSAGIAFGVALLSLVISGALFVIMQDMKNEVEQFRFKLRRTDILLEAVDLNLEPGMEYSGLQLEAPGRTERTEAEKALDQSKIAVALSQLRDISRAFVMRQVETGYVYFPPSEDIRSYTDLREILLEYTDLPPDPTRQGWVFLSYFRPDPEDYLLVVEARDSQRTLITVTSSEIIPWP